MSGRRLKISGHTAAVGVKLCPAAVHSQPVQYSEGCRARNCHYRSGSWGVVYSCPEEVCSPRCLCAKVPCFDACNPHGSSLRLGKVCCTHAPEGVSSLTCIFSREHHSRGPCCGRRGGASINQAPRPQNPARPNPLNASHEEAPFLYACTTYQPLSTLPSAVIRHGHPSASYPLIQAHADTPFSVVQPSRPAPFSLPSTMLGPPPA